MRVQNIFQECDEILCKISVALGGEMDAVDVDEFVVGREDIAEGVITEHGDRRVVVDIVLGVEDRGGIDALLHSEDIDVESGGGELIESGAATESEREVGDGIVEDGALAIDDDGTLETVLPEEMNVGEQFPHEDFVRCVPNGVAFGEDHDIGALVFTSEVR